MENKLGALSSFQLELALDFLYGYIPQFVSEDKFLFDYMLEAVKDVEIRFHWGFRQKYDL